MKFKQFLNVHAHPESLVESFNKPYRFQGGRGGGNTVVYKFYNEDKDEIEVVFEKLEWSEDEYSWIVAFNRDGSDGVTGGGDAMRIFATVIEILKEFAKKHKPPVIGFSAFKSVDDLANNKGDKKGSREKLYLRLIQKFAPKMGYTFSSHTDSKMTDFELVRK
jgi:hypothetical protein